MNQNQITGTPPGGQGTERQGSVRRAREMLAAGRRLEAEIPPPDARPRFPPPSINQAAHITQWPLPDNHGMGPRGIHPQPRPFVPRGPAPPRPRRPGDTPCSSIYSERSAPGFHPNPAYGKRPAPSFSQPLPYNTPRNPGAQRPIPSPTGTTDLTSRPSVTTEELYRQSATSSVGTIPDFPLPQEPSSAYVHPRMPPVGTNSHNSGGRTTNTRISSVSPIPEERHDGPRLAAVSYASSKAIPSSWGSTPAESEILGAYLDDDSDNRNQSRPIPHEDATLVRQASLGKRGKPSLRTIQKSNPNSYVATSEEHGGTVEPSVMANLAPEAARENGQEHGSNGTRFRDSTSSTSSTSSSAIDPEKGPMFLDVPNRDTNTSSDVGALEKEIEVLPISGPKMSEKRPDGRRPPRLDMDAVRNAEARGSLTSLPDLIRRATKLASRLDHGRTASRNELCDDGKEFKLPFKQRFRNSGSLSDILASFPHPGPGTSEAHSSWPVFFKKSNLQNIRSNDSETDQGRPRRRCCGMSPWVFALVCALITIAIVLAILLPIFLVVVPRQNANHMSKCEKTTPCMNGGVSVSSGDICSCVCTNGYTGSQCTDEGDSSCVTTEVNSKNATMGSELPRLFEDSQNNFSIPLDSFTLMALFSQNNVSCMTENALVSFRGVSSKARRSLPIALESDLDTPLHSRDEPSHTITSQASIQTLAPRASIATKDGIIYDASEPTQTTPTATASPTATRATHDTQETATPTPVPSKVIDFSRIAVLYIFQQTGGLDEAMKSEDTIQSYLTGQYSTSDSSKNSLDLSNAGHVSRFKLDFDNFTISTPNGTVVGGSD